MAARRKRAPRLLAALAPDWLTLVSGALIVFAFTPWDFAPLIWVAIVPWLFAIRRAPTKRAAFVQGVWLSVFMSLGGFYWVSYVLREFADLPWSLSVLGLVLYSLGGQPQFLVAAPLLKLAEAKLEPRAARSAWRWAVYALGLALVYAGVDWLIPKLFVDTFGHAFYRQPWLRQAADLGGAWSLTFLVFLANHAIFTLARRLRDRAEPSLWPAIEGAAPEAALVLALAVSATTYGAFRLETIRAKIESAPRHLQAGVIQGNIGDFDKLAAEHGIRGAAEKVLGTFFELSDKALMMHPRPDVLVWPETSYPSTFRTPTSATELARDQQVETYVRSRGVPLLFGGYDRAGGKDFNALYFLSPKPEPGVAGEGDLAVYHKSILLLFGEYIPLSDKIQFLRDAFPQVGNFGRGPGPQVLTIPPAGDRTFPVLASPIICYEALFPDFSLEAARKGSQLILNITNDSWFGPWGEPQLHLSLVVFRSIETRLPQLRSTNTGISALILPDGEITQPTAMDVPGVLNARVPLLEPQWTLMKAWGDWFGRFALLAGPCLLAAAALLGLGRSKAPPHDRRARHMSTN
jgi:apolipoprotein N-acyltransferase